MRHAFVTAILQYITSFCRMYSAPLISDTIVASRVRGFSFLHYDSGVEIAIHFNDTTPTVYLPCRTYSSTDWMNLVDRLKQIYSAQTCSVVNSPLGDYNAYRIKIMLDTTTPLLRGDLIVHSPSRHMGPHLTNF